METHVRWQIEEEPFPNKNPTQLRDRLFILQGNKVISRLCLFGRS